MDWFLNDRELRHERVKYNYSRNLSDFKPIFIWLEKNQHGVKKNKTSLRGVLRPCQRSARELFSKIVNLL